MENQPFHMGCRLITWLNSIAISYWQEAIDTHADYYNCSYLTGIASLKCPNNRDKSKLDSILLEFKQSHSNLHGMPDYWFQSQYSQKHQFPIELDWFTEEIRLLLCCHLMLYEAQKWHRVYKKQDMVVTTISTLRATARRIDRTQLHFT